MRVLYLNHFFYTDPNTPGNDPTMAYLVIILLFIAIIIAVFALHGKTPPLSKSFETPPSIDSSDSTFKDIKPESKLKGIQPYTKETDRDKETVSFYSYSPQRDMWICPNCETENSTASKKCRACGCVHL